MLGIIYKRKQHYFTTERKKQTMTNKEENIDNPPLWLMFVTGVWTMLALIGIFSFGMMCLGYWWAKS